MPTISWSCQPTYPDGAREIRSQDASLEGTFEQGGQKWRLTDFPTPTMAACTGFASCLRDRATILTHLLIAKECRAKLRRKISRSRWGRRGPIRVDSQNRWHFIWEGTGEHYFFNGTTAYWLIGWNDDKVIQSSIERLHQLKINRLRVTIAGRTSLFYGEPVMPEPVGHRSSRRGRARRDIRKAG